MDGTDKFLGVMLDNRYEILEKIGSGGMAVVYKARCHRLNRLVAVKILKEELAGDEDFRRRFHTESQAVAMLSHPNIVSVYDVSKTPRVDYIVMELIEGITLKQYINRKGLLGWKESLHFAMQICKAISHAHSKGIIHRDIKPHNIMILKDGSIKVADFGIARLISTQSTLTQESLGSVHYISPEQAKGGHVDARTDIYSLGVVMYEMLTSRLPFVGDSPVSVAIQHISAIPLQPGDINPDIPQGLEDITMHAMEPNLNMRYTTADEMLRDLEEFRKNPAATFVYTQSPAKIQDTSMGDTQPVPNGAIIKAAESKPPVRRNTEPKAIQRAPERRTPARTQEGLSRGAYKTASRRASRTALYAGTAAVLIILIAAFMFMWQYIIKDMFFPDDDYINVPDFIGYTYTAVRANPDYKERFIFEYAEDSNYNDLYDEGVVYDQSPNANQQLRVTDEKITVTLYVSLGKRPMPYMPNLVNIDYRTAKNEMTRIDEDNPDLRLNLSVVLEPVASDTVTKDMVIETVPREGEALSRNMSIYIRYSIGPEIKMVEVPDLTGMTLSAARLELESRNLTLGLPIEYIESDKAADIVLYNTKKGEQVAEHTEIMLQVSSGPAETPAPSPNPSPSLPPDYWVETPAPSHTPPPDATADVTPVANPEATPPDNN